MVVINDECRQSGDNLTLNTYITLDLLMQSAIWYTISRTFLIL